MSQEQPMTLQDIGNTAIQDGLKDAARFNLLTTAMLAEFTGVHTDTTNKVRNAFQAAGEAGKLTTMDDVRAVIDSVLE